jgi:hypothetical protein
MDVGMCGGGGRGGRGAAPSVATAARRGSGLRNPYLGPIGHDDFIICFYWSLGTWMGGSWLRGTRVPDLHTLSSHFPHAHDGSPRVTNTIVGVMWVCPGSPRCLVTNSRLLRFSPELYHRDHKRCPFPTPPTPPPRSTCWCVVNACVVFTCGVAVRLAEMAN